jgi:hypothetical protein
MTWVRIDDEFAQHPKVVAAGPLAMAMQVAALCYCNRNRTDGFVPWSAARSLVPWEFLGEGGGDKKFIRYTVRVSAEMVSHDVDCAMVIALLVRAGMWHEIEGGYTIHHYLKYNRSKEEVVASRETSKNQRAAAGKASAASRRKKYGTAQPNGQLNCQPTEPRTSRSAAVRETFVERSPSEPRTSSSAAVRETFVARTSNETQTTSPAPAIEHSSPAILQESARERVPNPTPIPAPLPTLPEEGGAPQPPKAELKGRATVITVHRPDGKIETLEGRPDPEVGRVTALVKGIWGAAYEKATGRLSHADDRTAYRVAEWAVRKKVSEADLRRLLPLHVAKGKGLALFPTCADDYDMRPARADVDPAYSPLRDLSGPVDVDHDNADEWAREQAETLRTKANIAAKKVGGRSA